jgi:transcription antitermination factor NusG
MNQESPLLTADKSSSVNPRNGWYALYTKHQHEKAVAELLSQKQFEVFLPLYSSLRRWKDRTKRLLIPLFPSYIFVRGGLDRRLQIFETPGVHSILTNEGRVALIPDSEIESVRRVVDGPLRFEPHPFLKCGDRVRLKWGALEGLEGILLRKKNLCRLVISIEMLAQSAAVEVDALAVEPVASWQENAARTPDLRAGRASLVGSPIFERAIPASSI